jgi:uncharacterized membrane protein
MKGARTGVGLVFGAALGLILGQMLFDNWWLGPMIGVAAGLIIGAVVDLLATDHVDRTDEEVP